MRADHLAGALDDDLRGVDLAVAEPSGIGFLPVGRSRVRQRVLPAEIIPVADVKAERDHVAAPRQFAQQPVGRRAGRAALRGEQLDDDRAAVGASR